MMDGGRWRSDEKGEMKRLGMRERLEKKSGLFQNLGFIIIVNAKKGVNGQSVPHVLLSEYVSSSLQVGKMIWSQVDPKSSHNELSAKEKAVREIGELFPDLVLMLKSDRGTND